MAYDIKCLNIKVSCLLLSCTLLLTSLSLSANNETGIYFTEGSWEDIKQIAQQYNKPIFVKAYTTWCMPCMQMQKYTFKDKELGNYYNQHFINYKIDIETLDGLNFKVAFGVSVIPDLLFFDSEGQLVHRERGGKGIEALKKLGADVWKKVGGRHVATPIPYLVNNEGRSRRIQSEADGTWAYKSTEDAPNTSTSTTNAPEETVTFTSTTTITTYPSPSTTKKHALKSANTNVSKSKSSSKSAIAQTNTKSGKSRKATSNNNTTANKRKSKSKKQKEFKEVIVAAPPISGTADYYEASLNMPAHKNTLQTEETGLDTTLATTDKEPNINNPFHNLLFAFLPELKSMIGEAIEAESTISPPSQSIAKQELVKPILNSQVDIPPTQLDTFEIVSSSKKKNNAIAKNNTNASKNQTTTPSPTTNRPSSIRFMTELADNSHMARPRRNYTNTPPKSNKPEVTYQLVSYRPPVKHSSFYTVYDMPLSQMHDQYAAGNFKSSFLYEYAYRLEQYNIPTAAIVNQYLERQQSKGNLKSPRNMQFIYDFALDFKSKALLILIANKEDYQSIYGDSTINAHIKNAILLGVEEVGLHKDRQGFNQLITLAQKANLPSTTLFLNILESNYYENCMEWDAYAIVTKKFMKDYQSKNAAFIARKAWGLLRASDKKADIRLACSWFERSVELEDRYYNNEALARTLAKLDKKDACLQVIKHALEVGQKEGADTSRLERLQKELTE